MTAMTVVDGLFLTRADGQDPFPGWMGVGADGRIPGIGAGEPPVREGTVLDATGKIIAPGFVSAHSHLHTSGLRGLAAGETMYPWVRANNEMLIGTDAEDMYWLALHGRPDFIGNGSTSAHNFTMNPVRWLYDQTTGRDGGGRDYGPARDHQPCALRGDRRESRGAAGEVRLVRQGRHARPADAVRPLRASHRRDDRRCRRHRKRGRVAAHLQRAARLG